MTHPVIATIASLAILTASCQAQEQSPGSWASLIKAKALTETALQLKETDQWPMILPPTGINRLAKEEQAEMLQRIDAVKEFLEKIEAEIEALSTLSEKALATGGYVNVLLADSFHRVILYRLSNWLISHPDDAAFCERLLTSVGPKMSQNDVDVLQIAADDDPRFIEEKPDFAQIDPTKSIYQSLRTLGIPERDVLEAAMVPWPQTSQLLETPSAISLAIRTTDTAAIREVHLAGLIEFFKKGGVVSELNAADVRAFEKRMGKSLRTFKSLQFGIRRLSVMHLLALFDIHKDPSIGAFFLKTALQ